MLGFKQNCFKFFCSKSKSNLKLLQRRPSQISSSLRRGTCLMYMPPNSGKSLRSLNAFEPLACGRYLTQVFAFKFLLSSLKSSLVFGALGLMKSHSNQVQVKSQVFRTHRSCGTLHCTLQCADKYNLGFNPCQTISY